MIPSMLLALAHGGCPPIAIDDSFPTSGATGVSPDQPLIVLVPDGACADDLALGVADQGGPRALPTVAERRGATWVYRVPEAPLTPNAPHQLVLFDGQNSALVAFETGDAPWADGSLAISMSGSELVGAGDGLYAPVGVWVETPAGNLLHWSGAAEPTDPWFATVSTGASSYEVVDAQVIDGQACVSARSEALDGSTTPWITTCEDVDRYDPPDDTGEPSLPEEDPPEEEDPVDTGSYGWEYGYYGYGSNDDGFVLFACGGCQSSSRTAPALLLPLLLTLVRRRDTIRTRAEVGR